MTITQMVEKKSRLIRNKKGCCSETKTNTEKSSWGLNDSTLLRGFESVFKTKPGKCGSGLEKNNKNISEVVLAKMGRTVVRGATRTARSTPTILYSLDPF